MDTKGVYVHTCLTHHRSIKLALVRTKVCPQAMQKCILMIPSRADADTHLEAAGSDPELWGGKKIRGEDRKGEKRGHMMSDRF